MEKKRLNNYPDDNSSENRYPGEILECASGTQILSIIECPVCTEVPFPPIFNCQIGHTICHGCKDKLNCCPLCKAAFSNARNFAVESIILSSTHACKNKGNGCTAILKGDLMVDHVKICRAKSIDCNCHLGRYTGCKYQNKALPLNKYLDHLKESHMLLPNVSKSPDIVFNSNVLSDTIDTFWRGDYAVFEGQTFVVRQFVKHSLVYFSLAIIANESIARKYVVDVKIISEIDKEAQIGWTIPVHSVILREDEILDHFCGTTTLSWIKGHCNIIPITSPGNNGSRKKQKMNFIVDYHIKQRAVAGGKGKNDNTSTMRKNSNLQKETENRLRQHGFVL